MEDTHGESSTHVSTESAESDVVESKTDSESDEAVAGKHSDSDGNDGSDVIRETDDGRVLDSDVLEQSSIDVDVGLLNEGLSGDVRQEVFSLFVQALQIENDRDELVDRVDAVTETLEQERADFESYKQQREERLEEERDQYVEDVFTGVTAVHSNMVRGLNADHDSVIDVKDGFEMTLHELETELENHGVTVIEPESGADVDPELHDVVGEVSAEDVGSDSIVRVHTPGYVFEGDVISQAAVVISE
jgi:molecular chaperone GrpE (heat shock protein)